MDSLRQSWISFIFLSVLSQPTLMKFQFVGQLYLAVRIIEDSVWVRIHVVVRILRHPCRQESIDWLHAPVYFVIRRLRLPWLR